ncbi:hypothetical protein N7454_010642 [Penicillium verhagenii]|nr:hypothetical protein N7454_010642 [Penicillium verhagenii]
MDDDYVAQVLAKEARDSSQKYSTEGVGAYMPRKISKARLPLHQNPHLAEGIIQTAPETRRGQAETIARNDTDPLGEDIEAALHLPTEIAHDDIDEGTKISGTDIQIPIGSAPNGDENVTGTNLLEKTGEKERDPTQDLAVDRRAKSVAPDRTAANDPVDPTPLTDHPIHTAHHENRTDDLNIMIINPLANTGFESGDESDPLEDLVGPLPANEAPVRSRGRGAYKANASNIDSHFASDYNPALDIQPDHDDERTATQATRRAVSGLMTGDDDWDTAMEALRDRARWRQKGEERLRAAGIGEETIGRWKTESAPSSGVTGERDAEDVRWSKKGEGREWDRGKFVNDDGHIDVRAAWS